MKPKCVAITFMMLTMVFGSMNLAAEDVDIWHFKESIRDSGILKSMHNYEARVILDKNGNARYYIIELGGMKNGSYSVSANGDIEMDVNLDWFNFKNSMYKGKISGDKMSGASLRNVDRGAPWKGKFTATRTVYTLTPFPTGIWDFRLSDYYGVLSFVPNNSKNPKQGKVFQIIGDKKTNVGTYNHKNGFKEGDTREVYLNLKLVGWPESRIVKTTVLGVSTHMEGRAVNMPVRMCIREYEKK